jgi:CP family cyanate transporter-like MFS transporter
MVPWVGLMLGAGRVTGPPHPPAAAVPAGAAFTGAVGKSRISWAIALVFATSSFNGYAMFAWLPMLLESHAGVSDVAAGQFLSLFAAMGIPAAIVVPLLASRMREPMRLVYPGVGAFVLGYLGLLALPGTATWLWVSAIGLGTLLFPLSLVLVNLRTSSYDGSVALSGFVQGIGYVLGAAGPLLVGVLHAASGSWTSPLVFLTVASLAVITAATLLMTPGSLENSLAGPTVPPALPVPAVPTHLTKERRT